MANKCRQPVTFTIYNDRCKGCGICVAFCAKNVFKLDRGKAKAVHPELCINCRFCEKLCPDYAIYLDAGKEKKNAGQTNGADAG